MRVLLATLNAKYIHSSLALRYLKSYIACEFPQVLLREFTINESPPAIAGEIYRAGAKVAAFSCYIWNIRETLEVVATLKRVSPETIIVLGGPEVSFDATALLDTNECIDFIVTGEGEKTFLELLRALQAKKEDFSSIHGLCYRDKQGTVRENPPRPPIAMLDDIPSPYGDIEADRGLDLDNRYVYYECSRGCPFSCQFCLSSTTTGVRFFSLERIEDDLDKLIRAGARQIKFVDRTFNARRSFALAIWRFLLEKVEERKRLGLPQPRFYFEIGADLLDGDEETMEFLKKVPPGVFQFEIGVQTADDRVNAIIGRQQKFARLSRVVRRLAESGNIKLHLDLIAGLPTEGYAAFRESFNAVTGLGADELQLGFLKLLKGTELRRRAPEFGYVWVDIPPYQVLASDAVTYDDLLRLERIEDLVTRYYNAHLADEALSYLGAVAFPSAFDMWEAFAAHWVKKGLHRQEHTRARLYDELASFGKGLLAYREEAAGSEGFRPADVFLHLLKFGWLQHDQSRRLPEWCPASELDEDEKERLWAALSGSDHRVSRRYGILEAFPFNPLEFKTWTKLPSEKTPTANHRRTILCFFYGPPGDRRFPAEIIEVASLAYGS